MTEEKYRRLMEELAPSRSDKDRMWARLEAARTGKDGHVMENVIRVNKRKSKALGWGPAIAAILMMALFTTLFIGVYQNGNFSLIPKGSGNARVLVPAGQGSESETESAKSQSEGAVTEVPVENTATETATSPEQEVQLGAAAVEKSAQAASEVNANLPKIRVTSTDFDQLWYPSYMGDPVLVDLELPDNWEAPQTMPVYSLGFMEGDWIEILKGSLQRWSQQMNVPLKWEELITEDISEGGFYLAALSAVSEDGNWVVMATSSNYYNAVEIHVFPLEAYALNATWPVGTVMNADPTAVGGDLERAGLMVENQEELSKEQNKDEAGRIAAIKRYTDSAIAEARAAHDAWYNYLPVKGDYGFASDTIRGPYGSANDIYNFTLRESFLTYGGDLGYYAVGESSTNDFTNALRNSRFMRLSWLTVADLSIGEDQNIYFAYGDPVPSPLKELFATQYWNGQDPMSVSRSMILGYKFTDYAATSAFMGDYPLRSLSDVEATLPELIAHPYSKNFDIHAIGMSYRRQEPFEDKPGALIPCYDFVLVGEGDGMSALPHVNLEISVPAIQTEYLELQEIPMGIME